MSAPTKKSLSPLEPVILVSKECVQTISSDDVDKRKADLGEKAWGLSCIPKQWTLPFFVLSSDIVDDLRAQRNLTDWLKNINLVASKLEFDHDSSIIIRSSAQNETCQEHGKYLSTTGFIGSIHDDLTLYLKQLDQDAEIKNESYPLIIQLHCKATHKGHLSNERRCYKEPRDWKGEFESRFQQPAFSINIRPWRQEVSLDDILNDKLECHIPFNIPKALRPVATWATEFNSRLHFEWVWNGSRAFIVQAEKEILSGDFNPKSLTQKPPNFRSTDDLQIIKPIDRELADKYSKIHNAYVYRDLGLGSVPLFALDDKDILNEIANGKFTKELSNDLEILTSRSLVIRTDITSKAQDERQMLPRTNEVRSFEEAKDWLTNKCKELLSEHSNYDIAFIFHNFIPSETSAFAFATPGKRKVEIEALWGIPEGLYYNSHDKYIVDTKKSSLDGSLPKLSDLRVKRRVNFKSFCVAANDDGTWTQRQIKAPHDWNESISREDWVKRIALESRKIAEMEQASVSIMWFVGLPDWASKDPVLPWFHEEYPEEKVPRSDNRRSKSVFDRIFTIETSKNLEELQDEVASGVKNIKQILVKPKEDELLRNKFTLKKIGELAKQNESIILLEGATLSHAYYQLEQTGASILIENPFDRDEEVQQFDKLVRDKVPDNIIAGGESVFTQHLTGEQLTKALREKLVEEAIEVLDATDHDSVLSELADVMEVIEALTNHLEADQRDILYKKKRKKEKAGGFEQGIILRKTQNPSPSSAPELDPNLSLDLDMEQSAINSIDSLRHVIRPAITKKTDKRTHPSKTESLLSIELPLILGDWNADSADIEVHSDGKTSMKAKLKGTRSGSQQKIELTISVINQQLDLL